MNERIEPAHWKAPRGYSNAVLASGRLLVIAGQIGWNEQQQFASDAFLPQAIQALTNIRTILEAAGGAPEHLVRMTWYVLDAAEYRSSTEDLGTQYRNIFGNHYPAMTLLVVAGLLEPRARLEIEATAVLTEKNV